MKLTLIVSLLLPFCNLFLENLKVFLRIVAHIIGICYGKFIFFGVLFRKP